MKQNPITRRAFALSTIALTALGLSSMATVSAAETPSPKPVDLKKPVKIYLEAQLISIKYAEACYIKDILAAVVSAAEGGDLFTGKVKIVADDRTNTLMIMTVPENMKIIKKLVQVLDIPVEEKTSVQQTSGGDSSTRAARASEPPQK